MYCLNIQRESDPDSDYCTTINYHVQVWRDGKIEKVITKKNFASILKAARNFPKGSLIQHVNGNIEII